MNTGILKGNITETIFDHMSNKEHSHIVERRN